MARDNYSRRKWLGMVATAPILAKGVQVQAAQTGAGIPKALRLGQPVAMSGPLMTRNVFGADRLRMIRQR